MIVLGLLGLVVVAVLAVVLVAAHMIDAESFEFTSRIWRVASLSITIRSPRKHGSQDDQV